MQLNFWSTCRSESILISLAVATCPFSWKHQATQHLQWLESGPKTTQQDWVTGLLNLFFTGEKTRVADGSLKLIVLTSHVEVQVIYNLLLKCWVDVCLSVVLFLFLFLIFLNPEKYQIKLRLLVVRQMLSLICYLKILVGLSYVLSSWANLSSSWWGGVRLSVSFAHSHVYFID